MRRLPAKHAADPLALDDDTVERLLTGELSPAQAPPAYAGVAAVLAAVAAPPSAEELSGHAAVLAELRAATRPRRAAARRAARPPRRRLGLAAVVLVGAVVTGGAAAAATGHLPAPVRDAARSILAPGGDGTPAPPAEPGSPPDPIATGGPTSADPTAGPQGSQSTGTTHRGPASTAAGPAGLDNKGLCRAYLASKDAEPGKKLETPAFQALARVAGGEDEIAGYCAELLPDRAKPKDEKDDQVQPGDQGQGQGQGGSPASR